MTQSPFRFLVPIIVAALSLGSCWPLPLARADEKPEKYALLVGVAKYKNSSMNKPALEYPEVDAADLARLLRASGYTVDLLVGGEAKQQAIRDKLVGMKQRGNDAGVVLIGLFGHGVEYEKDQTAYYCPFDTTIREVKDSQGRIVKGNDQQPLIEPEPESLIAMSELLSALRTCPAGNKAMLADCWRNSPNRPRGRAFGAKLQLKDVPENTAILFACSANEQAFESRDWGHGAFTKVLLDEITAMSQSGSVTMGALADRIKPKVVQLVKGQGGRDTQTPRSFISDTVDLQLVRLSTSKPTTPPPPSTNDSNLVGRTAGETRDDNGLKMKLVWCPPGRFTMGSPKSETDRSDDEDQIEVTLSNGFWLGQTEATQGQFQNVMGTTPWKAETFVKEGPDYAASYVSHDDAVSFCKKLTAQERTAGRLPNTWEYRLPTEAEWEYACRAGSSTKYSFGDDASRLSEYAYFDQNTLEIEERFAHRVGLKKPNTWGLMDMHGNVWEWCGDRYGSKLSGGLDPSGPSEGSYRVYRGGGWNHTPQDLRSAYRFKYPSGYRQFNLGFRALRSSVK